MSHLIFSIELHKYTYQKIFILFGKGIKCLFVDANSQFKLFTLMTLITKFTRYVQIAKLFFKGILLILTGNFSSSSMCLCIHTNKVHTFKKKKSLRICQKQNCSPHTQKKTQNPNLLLFSLYIHITLNNQQNFIASFLCLQRQELMLNFFCNERKPTSIILITVNFMKENKKLIRWTVTDKLNYMPLIQWDNFNTHSQMLAFLPK